MKTLRLFGTASLAAMLAGGVIAQSGCTYINRVLAKDNLNQGVIFFNQGKFNMAFDRIQKATRQDPENPNAWLFYGATLVKAYNNANNDEERKARQLEAIAAYENALAKSESIPIPQNRCQSKDNAIGYLAKIYDDMGNENKHREWLLKRTEGDCATDQVKAATYYSIGVGYWKKAYDETQRYADKAQATSNPFHYRNIYVAEDKKKFEDAVSAGFQYLENALKINPKYADALSYKSLLYREKQKTTNVTAEQKKYEDEAVKLAKEVIELNKQAAAQAPQG
jgi:tetratricopeptide (TPR) repeat protein